MQTGFVYCVFDTKTQQYLGLRHPAFEIARAAADQLDAGSEKARYTIYPVSVFPID